MNRSNHTNESMKSNLMYKTDDPTGDTNGDDTQLVDSRESEIPHGDPVQHEPRTHELKGPSPDSIRETNIEALWTKYNK